MKTMTLFKWEKDKFYEGENYMKKLSSTENMSTKKRRQQWILPVFQQWLTRKGRFSRMDLEFRRLDTPGRFGRGLIRSVTFGELRLLFGIKFGQNPCRLNAEFKIGNEVSNIGLFIKIWTFFMTMSIFGQNLDFQWKFGVLNKILTFDENLDFWTRFWLLMKIWTFEHFDCWEFWVKI